MNTTTVSPDFRQIFMTGLGAPLLLMLMLGYHARVLAWLRLADKGRWARTRAGDSS